MKNYNKKFFHLKCVLLILFPFFIVQYGSTQTDSLKTISMEVELSVVNLEKISEDLNDIFRQNGIIPELLKKQKYRLNTKFVLSESAFYVFIQEVEKWGYINVKNIYSINYTHKLLGLEQEIEHLEQEVEGYKAIVEKIDIQSSSHYNYWEKLENSKEQLKEKQNLRKEYLENNKKFKVELGIQETNLLANEPDFSFVNMPGVQFSYFVPASPTDGIYPASMNGYSIKYLLNRRKTYLELGLFKAHKQSENIRFDELYKFSVGQDLYSTHLGRGTRKFFNLYSGFKTGVFILTSDETNIRSWFATPSIGLEVYKNRNILIDTKGGYFLPFKENRNMRGFLFEASFNIVF